MNFWHIVKPYPWAFLDSIRGLFWIPWAFLDSVNDFPLRGIDLEEVMGWGTGLIMSAGRKMGVEAGKAGYALARLPFFGHW